MAAFLKDNNYDYRAFIPTSPGNLLHTLVTGFFCPVCQQAGRSKTCVYHFSRTGFVCLWYWGQLCQGSNTTTASAQTFMDAPGHRCRGPIPWRLPCVSVTPPAGPPKLPNNRTPALYLCCLGFLRICGHGFQTSCT